jgi:hypothetical protein
MGLDCFIRKISKSVAHSAMGRTNLDPLEEIGYHGGVKSEIGYWRGWRSLNRHIISNAVLKRVSIPGCFTKPSEMLFNGKAILLSQEDILEIKLEVLWGDLWRDREEKILPYESSGPYGAEVLSKQKNRDIEIFDHALRVLKNNRSYVYYLGSW